MTSSEFTTLLDSYLVRLDAGESFRQSEIREKHPEHAQEIWDHLVRWNDVAMAFPRKPAAQEPGPAIRFHTITPNSASEMMSSGTLDPHKLARQFAARGDTMQRYEVVEEIARGGMGVIVRVVDRDLGRDLAMKVMLTGTSVDARGIKHPVPKAALARFVEEARITGRLEHPGIPSVHDFGVDSAGNFYFTMPWIRGETLEGVLLRVGAQQQGWDQARALGMLLQVCDAVGYAHSKGVIHRDIKPRNIMVGEFGEVLVMDWGLARDRARGAVTNVQLADQDERDASPVMTRDGVVIGTPCYMSPEQARGDMDKISPQTDVYAIGAILYELLIGHPPYAPRGSDTPPLGIVRLVREGPPVAVLDERRQVPPELVAICERAMARETHRRFANVGELGQELRAYLEGRVVASFATGAWIELRKWVGRNKGVAVLGASLVAVSICAALLLANGERERRLLTEQERDRAVAYQLVGSADDLGPIAPQSVPRMERWIVDAENSVASLGRYEGLLLNFVNTHGENAREQIPETEYAVELERLGSARAIVASRAKRMQVFRDQLSSTTPGPDLDIVASELTTLEHEQIALVAGIARREWIADSRLAWRFVDKELRRAHERLHQHTSDLDQLANPTHGKLNKVRSRLQLAETIESRSIADHAAQWATAIEAIADEGRSPLYRGLELEPQIGLVPLGPNEAGLWEFWHVLSGSRPVARMEGGYDLQFEDGIVLILVPGGTYATGAQATDAGKPNYSAPPPANEEGEREWSLRSDEELVFMVQLAPYFLSKYELSQDQWFRLQGKNPSQQYAGLTVISMGIVPPSQPLENVTWEESTELLALWSLHLPTEAQWEAAARAGTGGYHWWGDAWPPPELSVNGIDTELFAAQNETGGEDGTEDGFPIGAPIGTFRQNPWGFHSILGNVNEWCSDWFTGKRAQATVAPDTGEFYRPLSRKKAFRGGSYLNGARGLHTSRRYLAAPDKRIEDVGVRPMRPLD